MSTLTAVLLVVVLCVVGFVVARYLFNLDERVEDRRREAAKLAGVLYGYGLRRLPAILIDYSVGDYSGMTNRIVQFVELLSADESAVVKEFDSIFDRVLNVKLQTEEGRIYIAAKVGEADENAKTQ